MSVEVEVAVDEAYWILDFCAGCGQLVWLDVMEALCPECLGR